MTRRLSIPHEVIYAREFGVKADDTSSGTGTDDVSALSAALDQLNKTYTDYKSATMNCGGTLILPLGYSRLNSVLNLDVGAVENVGGRMIGGGMRGSCFHWTGGNGVATSAILRPNPSLASSGNPVNGQSRWFFSDFGVDVDNKSYAGRVFDLYGMNIFDLERIRVDGGASSSNPPVAGQVAYRTGDLDGVHGMFRGCLALNISKGFRIGTDWTALMNCEGDQTNEYGLEILNSPYGPFVWHFQGFQSGGNTVFSSNNDTGGDGAMRIPFLQAIFDEQDPLTGWAAKSNSIVNSVLGGERMFVLGAEQRSITQPQPTLFGGAGRTRIAYIPLSGVNDGWDALQRDPVFNLSGVGGVINQLSGIAKHDKLVNSGAISSTINAAGYGTTFSTGVTNASVSGTEWGTSTAPITQRRWFPKLKLQFSVQQTLAFRMFVGLASIDIDTLLNTQDGSLTGGYVGVWVGTDDAVNPGNIKFMSRNDNGGARSVTDTGLAIDTTAREFHMNLGDTTGAQGCNMELWGKADWQKYKFELSHTNNPDSATNLMLVMGIRNLAAADKLLNVYYCRLDQQ